MKRLLMISILMVITLSYITYSQPVEETVFVEVLSLKNGIWESRFILLLSNKLSLQIEDTKAVIIRVDSTSHIKPAKIFLDGKEVPQTLGLSFTGDAVFINTSLHKGKLLQIIFEERNATAPVMGLFGEGEEIPVTKPGLIKLYDLPGIKAYGFLFKVILLKPGELSEIFDSYAFIVSYHRLRVEGAEKDLKAYEVELIIPRKRVQIRKIPLSLTYRPLYKADVIIGEYYFRIIFPPSTLKFVYLNLPPIVDTNISYSKNLLAKNLKRPVLLRVNNTLSISYKVKPVSLNIVKKPSNGCRKPKITFDVITGTEEYRNVREFIPEYNFTYKIRVYADNVAIKDFLILSTPLKLTITEPVYKLHVELLDDNMNPLHGAYIEIYGKFKRYVYQLDKSKNEIDICYLPEGNYTIKIYVQKREVGWEHIRLKGDESIEIACKVSDFKVRVLRAFTGEYLKEFRATLQSYDNTTYVSVHAYNDEAVFVDIPYGNYRIEIFYNGTRIYEGEITVPLTNNQYVVSVDLNAVTIKVYGVLGNILKDIKVSVMQDNETVVQGETNSYGRFHITYLRSGNYTICLETLGICRLENIQGDKIVIFRTEILSIIFGVPITLNHLYIFILVIGVLLLILVAKKKLPKRNSDIIVVD